MRDAESRPEVPAGMTTDRRVLHCKDRGHLVHVAGSAICRKHSVVKSIHIVHNHWKTELEVLVVQLVLGRVIAFVVEFEASKDMSESQHAEWAGSRARVAVLRALASALSATAPQAAAPAAEALRAAAQEALDTSGTAPLLLRWLMSLCADTTVLLTESPAVHQVRHADIAVFMHRRNSAICSLSLAAVAGPCLFPVYEASEGSCRRAALALRFRVAGRACCQCMKRRRYTGVPLRCVHARRVHSSTCAVCCVL